MTENTDPAPPDNPGTAGVDFWTSLVGPYEFDVRELAVVTEAARVKTASTPWKSSSARKASPSHPRKG